MWARLRTYMRLCVSNVSNLSSCIYVTDFIGEIVRHFSRQSLDSHAGRSAIKYSRSGFDG
jgi:hypothetical protein